MGAPALPPPLEGRPVRLRAREPRGAAAGLCRFGFELMNLHRIELWVRAEHERAIRLCERLGFQREGTRRQAAWQFGRRYDLRRMAGLDGELRESPGAPQVPSRTTR